MVPNGIYGPMSPDVEVDDEFYETRDGHIHSKAVMSAAIHHKIRAGSPLAMRRSRPAAGGPAFRRYHSHQVSLTSHAH